jgi:hypothetical protein
MDMKRVLLFLALAIVGCKSLDPNGITIAKPIKIQHFSHQKDTGIAFLFPDPELPNNHYKHLIRLARRQQLTLLIVRWSGFDQRDSFFQNAYLPAAEAQLFDSTARFTNRGNVQWIITQGDWLVTATKLAQGVMPKWFIPLDGYWQTLDLEWIVAANQSTVPAWLDSTQTSEQLLRQIQRVQMNPTRDSLWMGRSHHYWNYLMAQGSVSLPTTCKTQWITSSTHPWLSDPSIETMNAVLSHEAIPFPHNQPAFYKAVAKWLEVN